VEQHEGTEGNENVGEDDAHGLSLSLEEVLEDGVGDWWLIGK